MLALNVLALAGCATSTGQAWVQEPEEAFRSAASPDLARVTAADGESLNVARVAEPNLAQTGEAPRHRLDHVVSLGEGEGAAPAPLSPPMGSTTPPVVVNIVNYAAPSSGYGYPSSYGSDYTPRVASPRSPVAGATRVAPVHVRASGGTPPLGHDWQAAPSYGPNFPYHTGPASAWERPR